MFRNRVRRVGRHTHDSDARLRRRQIDVIEARRAQCDEPRAAGAQTFDHGGIDVIVDERAHGFVAIREDGRFGIEIRLLEVEFIAERGVGFVERIDVVLTAAEQDHAYELLPIPRARLAGDKAIADIAAATMAMTTGVITAVTPQDDHTPVIRPASRADPRGPVPRAQARARPPWPCRERSVRARNR